MRQDRLLNMRARRKLKKYVNEPVSLCGHISSVVLILAERWNHWGSVSPSEMYSRTITSEPLEVE